MTKVKFENTELTVHETNNSKQWYMTIEEVAKAYGCDRTNIVKQLGRHSDEIRSGIEKDVTNSHTPGGIQNITILYKEGVIKLGFFIRSKKAKDFRQFAANIILDALDKRNMMPDEFLAKIDHFMEKTSYEMREMRGICVGLRSDVDELQMALSCLIDDKEHDAIRKELKKTKQHLNIDGRKLAGMIRKTLGISTYKAPMAGKRIINCCRILRGEGIKMIKSETKEN